MRTTLSDQAEQGRCANWLTDLSLLHPRYGTAELCAHHVFVIAHLVSSVAESGVCMYVCVFGQTGFLLFLNRSYFLHGIESKET